MLNDEVSGNKRLRNEHQKKVLNLIRLSGQISRVDIGNRIDLSKATVTRVIDDLLKEGLVREAGQAESKVGRKKTFLEIVPNSCFAIGVNLSKNYVYASLIDITMKSLGKVEHSLRGVRSNEEFYHLIISVIEELLEKTRVSVDSILGIGVGVPGLVDFESGVIWKLDITHSLANVSLKDKLEHHFNLPATVDNNVNTLALGEYWFGYGWAENVQQLVYIFSSEGVGGGVVTDGRLFRGKHNIAAEIGEMIVNMDDPATKGRVEDYCSTDVVESVTNMAFEEACKLALEGDPLCKNAIEQAIKALGVGLVNVINLLDPEIVVLSGKFIEAYPPFFAKVETYARSLMVSEISRQVKILRRAYYDAPYEIGAAALIFIPFFND
jgi:predicted NBD/HSP70 family sugar kinase